MLLQPISAIDLILSGQQDLILSKGAGRVSKTRTIILGASHWHVPLYARAIGEEHQVVGISDDNVPLVQGLAKAWGAPVEADWRMLLDLPDVELAYVFGPHDRMAETCLALIERRIPFVVEKPLGTSLAELSQVRRAAEEAGVPATVPLIQRGGPADSWLAKAGRPAYQRLSFIAGPPERYLDNGNPWMLDPATPGAAAWRTWGRISWTCSCRPATSLAVSVALAALVDPARRGR